MAAAAGVAVAGAVSICRPSSSYASTSSSSSSSPSAAAPGGVRARRGIPSSFPAGENASFVGRPLDGFGLSLRVCHFQSRDGRRCALADGGSNGSSASNGSGGNNGAGGGGSAGDAAAADISKLKSRRDMLQEYVKNVQPEFMEKFVQRAPGQVVEAMRQTVTNMLGTLPPQFFEISVSTVAENLAQLMYSVMMTGYMFRNAQFRLDLQQSLTQGALPDPATKGESQYEPGVDKGKVSGNVLRWHREDGVERVPAVEYIEMLEAEVYELKQQIESNQRLSRGRNVLLEYLKSLQPQNLKELTATAGGDALEAMNTFITRLLGVKDPSQLKRSATETSAAELAKLLYWLMVVGYSIRNMEVRFDMERILGVPVPTQKLGELPPGEDV